MWWTMDSATRTAVPSSPQGSIYQCETAILQKYRNLCPTGLATVHQLQSALLRRHLDGRMEDSDEPKLKARNFDNQKTEARIDANVLNPMTELGRPEFLPVT